MYYDPTIVAITRILARTPRLTRSLVRIGRLNYKAHLEEGTISDGTSVAYVVIELW